MPIEITAVLLMFLSARWVYLLAKRFDKRRFTYTVMAVVVYLVGGIILSFITTFILLMTYGEFAFNYEVLTAAFFTLLGAGAVGIYYWILRRKWKKGAKLLKNSDVLDDGVKS